jgi:hypothetical protein
MPCGKSVRLITWRSYSLRWAVCLILGLTTPQFRQIPAGLLRGEPPSSQSTPMASTCCICLPSLVRGDPYLWSNNTRLRSYRLGADTIAAVPSQFMVILIDLAIAFSGGPQKVGRPVLRVQAKAVNQVLRPIGQRSHGDQSVSLHHIELISE